MRAERKSDPALPRPKEGEMEAEDISRAVAELHEAEEEFQLAKNVLSEARSKETSAINRLNKAQKCLDNMIKELKAAPRKNLIGTEGSLTMTEKRECDTCRFAERLEEELRWRYNCTDVDTASPSTILLAVLNAVAEARRQPLDAEVASADRDGKEE